MKSVAVLTNSLYAYQAAVIEGVRHALRPHGLCATLYVGRTLRGRHDPVMPANEIYRLIAPARHVGVITLTSSLGSSLDDSELLAWARMFGGLPLVSVGRRLAGASSLYVDNRPGMRDLMRHLLDVRRFRRLAFVRGTVGNVDSEAREAIFREALAERGIALDERRVLNGDFASSRAFEAMTQLLQATRDVDAVVCANDEMTEGVIQAITASGLRVPEDIGVSGFDDSEDFQHVVPRLTTVRQPFFEQGAEAARLLVGMVAGDQGPRDVSVGTVLVVRASCGHRSSEQQPRGNSALFEDVARQQVPLLRLFDEVHARPDDHARFLSQWQETLLQRPRLDQEFSVWRDGLHAQVQAAPDAAGAWQLGFAALAVLGNALQMLNSRRFLLDINTTKVSAQLFAVNDETELFEALSRYIDHVRLQRHALVLYERPGPQPDGWSHVRLAKGMGDRIHHGVFPTRQLVPDGMGDVLATEQLVVSPLTVNERHYGYLIHEPPRLGRFDEEGLCHTVSHALRHFEQTRALQQHADELEAQVQARTRELQGQIVERLRAEQALLDANVELQRFAFLDGLTQIYNRAAFNEQLQSQWVLHERHGRPLSLVLCDVDHFKKYNDRYGHVKGDDCLRQVAQAIARSVRNLADTVARYGGEEFVVVLPETDAAGALKVAQRMQEEIQRQAIVHDASDVGPLVTFSVGVATVVPQAGQSPERLIDLADGCLYRAKRAGRARVVQSVLPSRRPLEPAPPALGHDAAS